MFINHQVHIAHEIASQAECETVDTYTDVIDRYRENNYSFIPLPFDQQYYHVENDFLEEFTGSQIIDPSQPIKEAITRLRSEPFLFATGYGVGSPMYEVTDDGLQRHTSIEVSFNSEEGMYGVEEFVDEHPEHKEEVVKREQAAGNFFIITYADLNKRGARGMLYQFIAELERLLAERVERVCTDSTELFRDTRPSTIGRWEKAKLDGVEVHIAEYITLSEMQKVIGKSDELLEVCGFPSRSQFDDQMSGLVNLRNKVMHANRTLVHGPDEIEKLVERIERAQTMVEKLTDSDLVSE
jgi:hypothetical protein